MKLPAIPPPQPGFMLDLSGDRVIEWSWIYAKIPAGPGKALDFGTGNSNLCTAAAMRGYDTLSVDLGVIRRPLLLPNLRFIQGDLNDLALPERQYDLIINCSTVEHVGIAGRYDVKVDEEDGDLKAMWKLRQLMKPEAVHLLTVPVGLDAVWRPLHRVYGPQRLPRLLEGYRIKSKRCWTKDWFNRWVLTNEDDALRMPTSPELYGIGCYELIRDDTAEDRQ